MNCSLFRNAAKNIKLRKRRLYLIFFEDGAPKIEPGATLKCERIGKK